jgi:DNA transposition AAA+ family ATPase
MKADEKIKIRRLKEMNLILETSNFSTCQRICRDAQTNKKMIAITGNPGYGKTTALEYYVATCNDYPAYFVTVKPSMSPVQFYREISHGMRISAGNTIYDCIKAVSERLNREEHSLLVIDEAGKFTPKMLQYLHELRDYTRESAGIVLSGPEYFKNNLVNWVYKDKIGMSEVFRRINYWQELVSPSKEEIYSICIGHGIEDKDIIRQLQNKCKNFGALHNEIMDLKVQQENLEELEIV